MILTAVRLVRRVEAVRGAVAGPRGRDALSVVAPQLRLLVAGSGMAAGLVTSIAAVAFSVAAPQTRDALSAQARELVLGAAGWGGWKGDMKGLSG